MPKRLRRSKVGPGEVRASDFWRTPPACFAFLDREFGFGLDLAANESDHLRAEWFGPGGLVVDALDEGFSWAELAAARGVRAAFLNPPYSSRLVRAFLERAAREAEAGLTIAALIPDTLDTKWYRAGEWAAEIRRIPHRVGYLKADGTTPAGAMFPSCVAVFRPQPGVQFGGPRVVSWTWKTPKDKAPKEAR